MGPAGRETLGALFAEAPENKRRDDEIEQRAGENAAEDHDRDGMQDFTARFVRRR